MLFELSPQDSHLATVAGRDTVALCTMQKISPRLKTSHQDRIDSNARGFKAEFAVARLLGIDPPGVNVASDGGIDLWFDDVSIDVKLTTRHQGDLIFDTPDKFKSRVAILVASTDDPNVMSIEGWMGRPEFISKAKRKDYGHGPRLFIPNSNLHPIEELWLEVMRRRHSPK